MPGGRQGGERSPEMRLTVLGCGRWGTFLLWYARRLGMEATGWEPAGSPVLRSLAKNGCNRYLTLPQEVVLTDSLEEALRCDILLAAVPSQEWRSLAEKIGGKGLEGADLVLCMKGLEKGTGLRLSQVAESAGMRPRSVSALLGPGHPQQLVRGIPTCMLAASADEEAARRISEVLGSSLVRMYRSQDMIGCEIGAAAKNVVGIAAGMLDGLGFAGLKGALMARAPQEVARVVAASGGDWRSVYGLSHLGDYEATLFSPLSRNRAFGESVVRGRAFEGLAEGFHAADALCDLASSLGVEVPITSAVRDVVHGACTAAEAVERLFGRPSKEEFQPGFGCPPGEPGR